MSMNISKPCKTKIVSLKSSAMFLREGRKGKNAFIEQLNNDDGDDSNNNDNNNNNNNNNNLPETRKYWVDVQRGIVSSHGERDPL